jgi:hypothetical protein
LTKAAYYFPVLSRDGNLLYFFLGEWPDGPTGMPRQSLWKINVDGANLRMIANSQLFEQPLSWKPQSRPD